MRGTERGGSGAGHPYFFLSYAHTHRRQGAPDPDVWVEQFYHDLVDHIVAMTDVRTDVPVGFMDRELDVGSDWPAELAAALEHCRVFVPLYSPRYFGSEECGREWWVFLQRVLTGRTAGPARPGTEPTPIVPALWVPVNPDDLPETAVTLQYTMQDLGPEYAAEGLYGLGKLTDFRPQYEMAVYKLAKRIIEAAEHPAPAGTPREYRAVPSAFRHTADARQLDLEVLACTADRLPAGRSPHCYGRRPREWNPYPAQSPRPLVETAADHARGLDYRVRVTEHPPAVPPGPVGATHPGVAPGLPLPPDDAPDPLRPAAPTLMLVDPWAARTPAQRTRLRQDLVRRPWLHVLLPWNTADPDSARWAGGASGGPTGSDTAPRSGRLVTSLEEFVQRLPTEIGRAVRLYTTYAPVPAPTGPPQAKPRLLGRGRIPAPYGHPRLPPPGPFPTASTDTEDRDAEQR